MECGSCGAPHSTAGCGENVLISTELEWTLVWFRVTYLRFPGKNRINRTSARHRPPHRCDRSELRELMHVTRCSLCFQTNRHSTTFAPEHQHRLNNSLLLGGRDRRRTSSSGCGRAPTTAFLPMSYCLICHLATPAPTIPPGSSAGE